MAQFLRPTSDVSIASNILNSTGLPDFYTSIDEVVPDDSSTFLESTVNLGVNSIFSLSTGIDPGINTNHILRVRCFGDGGSFSFLLKQGGVTIFEVLNEDFSDGTWRTVSYAIPELDIANITDYSDLTFEFNVPSQGNRGEVLYISQAELEIPDAGGGLIKVIKVDNNWKNIDNILVATQGAWKNYQDLKIKSQNNWKNT